MHKNIIGSQVIVNRISMMKSAGILVIILALLFGVAFCMAQEAGAKLDEYSKLYKDRKFEECVQKLQPLVAGITDADEKITALEILANCHSMLMRLENAKKDKKDPDIVRGHLEKQIEYLKVIALTENVTNEEHRMKLVTQALIAVRRAVKKDEMPSFFDNVLAVKPELSRKNINNILLIKAGVVAYNGWANEEDKIYRQIISADGGDFLGIAKAKNKLAYMLIDRKARPREALELLAYPDESIIESDKGGRESSEILADKYHNAALAYKYLGKPLEAEQNFQKAIDIASKDKRLLKVMREFEIELAWHIVLDQEVKDPGRIEEILMHMNELGEYNSKAIILNARYLEKNGKKEEARKQYERVASYKGWADPRYRQEARVKLERVDE